MEGCGDLDPAPSVRRPATAANAVAAELGRPCPARGTATRGSGSGRSLCLWLHSWQAGMTYRPRLFHEHGTANRLPGRLPLSFLTIRYQSHIILLGRRSSTPQPTGGIRCTHPMTTPLRKACAGVDISPAIRHATHNLAMGVPPPPCLGRRAHCPWHRLGRPLHRYALFGGNDWKTYGWTMVFLALAAAQLSFATWELAIARSASART